MSSDRDGDGRSAPRRLPIVLVSLAVAVAAAMGFLWVRDRGASPAEIDSSLARNIPSIAERAQTLTKLLMDYTPRTLQQRSDQLLALSTGDFRDQYEKLLQGGLDTALTKAHTTAKARIVDGPDVSFTSSAEAQAVLRIIQTTKKKGALIARHIYYVLRFTMQNESTDAALTDWRASKFEILSQQST
jgi:type IV secretory pathway component VirB8